MAFNVEISEVTAAEFPLMDVLRDTVFGEFGFVSRAPMERGLAGKQDLFLLMAHLEGNPVGFSAGCRRKPHDFYINFVAVLKDYRRQGLGRQFVTQMEMFARSRGYERIEFNTQNRFPGMMRLGLKLGFRPIGLEQHDGTMNDLQIRFGKTFGKDEPIDAGLLAAIDAGDEIAGMIREPSGKLKVILRSEAS